MFIIMYPVGLCFILCGLYLVRFAFKERQRIQHLIQTGLPVTGVVIETLEEDEYYFLIIEYQTQTGQILKTKTRQDTVSVGINNSSSYSQKVSPGFRVNDLVDILYDPANPTDIIIDTPYYKHTSAILVFVLGVVIIVGGIFIFREY
ncbi:DUF3592 domain-containing protein [Cytophagaceae bacterium YF14B1]|uniref:DUF3592 domain-containing protein n=1 Tax=Xanthocytophaga flava TaxID=3048013 RepID=A0AAE3UC19_9BACT|nr:DUF3592 domain-containing protein [Xanthocytophaga flavus]MDJ1486347.1 DUF3592 domain-containing protein [Xanthocytophaga flavus]